MTNHVVVIHVLDEDRSWWAYVPDKSFKRNFESASTLSSDVFHCKYCERDCTYTLWQRILSCEDVVIYRGNAPRPVVPVMQIYHCHHAGTPVQFLTPIELIHPDSVTSVLAERIHHAEYRVRVLKEQEAAHLQKSRASGR